LFWAVALGLFAGAAGSYYKQFYLPYKGVSFKGCPSTCSYNSDCAVPGCSSKLRCVQGKCQFPNQHASFLNFTLITLMGLFGAGFAFISYAKQSNSLKVDEKGIHYNSLFKTVSMPWEDFLGISFHGVNTRLGKDATVYSLTGDSGLFSFLSPGLPKGTSTRELSLGSFFWLSLTEEERDKLLEAIEHYTGQKPEPEYEW
jgi:hypothetical protein